jgi:hypothetical protein
MSVVEVGRAPPSSHYLFIATGPSWGPVCTACVGTLGGTHMRTRCRLTTALVVMLLVSLLATTAFARRPIRNAFFDYYPVAVGTQLDNLPSNANHCGVCHFDFDGGGPRNPYGLSVQVGINNGLTFTEAIAAVDGDDADADGYTNHVEITSGALFLNTPTFPGLNSSNYTSTSNVDLSDIEPYLTPMGSADTTPPSVAVSSPNGGESINANTYYAISYSATDASGISSVDIYLSDDSGATWEPVDKDVSPGSGYSWFVINYPGDFNRIRIVAHDGAGNIGDDMSDTDFTIIGRPPGVVPTTMRDVKMSGTQPHEGAILADPDESCATCHGGYNPPSEPWFNWRGSMMGQSARDPFFYACLAVAEQDAPGAGDLCIRCHSPGGWEEGHSVDTSGALLTVKDRHGVQCDFCHRAVDYSYLPGVSPIQDYDVLQNIDPLPLQYGNGQFINDPAPLMRGPFDDAVASHETVYSPFHRSAAMCGTCHDVSSPVFERTGDYDYTPTPFDQEHPTMDVRDMIPVERTFSEWSQSEYASTGVYAPQFAGNKPDGIVSNCEDCHMHDIAGKGCSEPGAPTRSDLPLHDFTGGNTFVPDIIDQFYPDEVDAAQLADAKSRATSMIQKAATLELTPEDFGVTVRVINETGHRLPSGYPEGRRVFLNVVAYDAGGTPVYESGHYDFSTGILTHDEDAKIYDVHPGVSPALASALGAPEGPSFHFVLSDTVFTDNRIPPRGFTNAGFIEIQSPPVGYSYEDGQYWDDTDYHLPDGADSVHVWVYYQTTTKEYVEFLRDANMTNATGQNLYDAWVGQGKAPPVLIIDDGIGVDVQTGVDEVAYVNSLSQNFPNPFNPVTTVRFSLAEKGPVNITVYDVSGREVRVLVDEVREAGPQSVVWDGRNDLGQKLGSGVYFIRYQAGMDSFWKKAALLK